MADRPDVPVVIVVMGVSGCGKSTIGEQLAAALDAAFVEGDRHHSPANIEKMRGGAPLTDTDRQPWLLRLAGEIDGWLAANRRTVLACSALKRAYRTTLIGGNPRVGLVHLHGAFDLIERRLAARTDHYMPPDLLVSQFRALEFPDEALNVDIGPRPQEMLQAIRTATRWW